MKVLVQDTWFPSGTRIRIGGGVDEILFLQCSFDGGDIFIEPDVDRTIFSQCRFRGTNFSGQKLSERIAIGCRAAPADTEETAAAAGARDGRFRR